MKDDASDTRGTSNTGQTMMGFALGAVVGAGLALLLAPASGGKTRERIASTARRWTKNARETLNDARETVGDFGADARSAVDAGRKAFRHDDQNSDPPRPAPQTAMKG